MKIIDKILDNYFKNKVIDYVLQVKHIYRLDSIIIEHKGGEIEIQFKPKYYKIYTTVYRFEKKDSLKELIYLISSSRSYIYKRIQELDKENLWAKR